MTQHSTSDLSTGLAQLRLRIKELEVQALDLTAQRDSAQADVNALRSDVRAGRATIEVLMAAESKLTALHNLLEQHLEETTAAYVEADDLAKMLGDSHDQERLELLAQARAALLEQRDEQEAGLVAQLRDAFRDLSRTNREIVAQAQEMMALRLKLNPHAPPALDDVHSDAGKTGSFYSWRDRLSRIGTDGFRSLVMSGGPELLVMEIEREEGMA